MGTDDKLPCPYRGLFHFGPDDAQYFFGRDIFIEEIYSAIETRHFLPILGASGSGKSSVVFAGLVPKLQQEGNWLFTHFRPGSDPFHALSLALIAIYAPNLNETEVIIQSRQLRTSLLKGEISLTDIFTQIQNNYPNQRLLLIADQFEELYTLCDDLKTQQNFLNVLTSNFSQDKNIGLSSPSNLSPVLVTTMRTDFLGNALSYPSFADLLRKNDTKIRSMNRQELTEVIEKPAHQLGIIFESGLVDRILDDIEAQPGNLPLLEFALTELWNQRTCKQLTHEIYEKIGQVQGALARHADKKYKKLTEIEKEKVRQIFVQLVRPGEGTEDTRRIAIKEELGEENWSLVKQLADARLVVTSRNQTEQETVEVVHEALIRNWGELREWMKTDRVFRAWQERLRVLKKQWEAENKDKGSLLRGAALVEAEEQLKERPDQLLAEKVFIEKSIKEEDRIKNRKKIITASIVIGSLMAVVVSSSLGLMARYQAQQAELNLADSRGRNAISLLAEGKDLEAFIEAIKVGNILKKRNVRVKDPQVMAALMNNIYNADERNRLQGHQGDVRSVSISADGQTVASASWDGTVKLWNVQTGELIRTLQGHQDEVNSVSISPDGQMLASGSFDKTVKLWNLQTGELIRTLQGHQDEVNSVSISPNGRILASGSLDKTVKLWNLQTGELIHTLEGHQNSVYSVNISPDGRILASGSVDKTVKLWNLQTGELIRTLEGHQNYVWSVSISPDGQTLASGSLDGTVKLWNVQTGELIRTLPGHQKSVNSVRISPDGQTLASGSGDRTVKLWNVQTGELIRTLPGHKNAVLSMSFSLNGQTLASGSFDKTVKLWNVQTGEFIRILEGHQEAIESISISPDGQTLASGSRNQTVKLWNLQTGQLIRTLEGHQSWVHSLSFSPDGQTLASGSGDQTVKLWNLQTGELIRTLEGHQNEVWSVSISPDSQILASGSLDGTVKLWNLQTGEEIRTLEGHQNSVYSVNISPDSQILASGSSDSTVKLWNLQTGEEIRTLEGHQEDVYGLSFSPDGQTLASGSKDLMVKLWNLQTGELIRTLEGHQDSVYGVSFSPDGHTLASGSFDKTVKLWNVQTGELIHTLEGHQDWVYSVSFSPDGQTLASGSLDGKVKLWPIDFDFLMERSCDWVRPYLRHNPNVSEEDRRICDEIPQRERQKM